MIGTACQWATGGLMQAAAETCHRHSGWGRRFQECFQDAIDKLPRWMLESCQRRLLQRCKTPRVPPFTFHQSCSRREEDETDCRWCLCGHQRASCMLSPCDSAFLQVLCGPYRIGCANKANILRAFPEACALIFASVHSPSVLERCWRLEDRLKFGSNRVDSQRSSSRVDNRTPVCCDHARNALDTHVHFAARPSQIRHALVKARTMG
jgi:hypothetical protein